MSGALKNDQDKPDLSLIPYIAEKRLAEAMMIGLKYGRYNYCQGMEASRMVAAAKRHLAKWFDGEDFDEDGQHHLGSVMANCLMILRQEELDTLVDDRYFPEEPTPEPEQKNDITPSDGPYVVLCRLASGQEQVMDGIYHSTGEAQQVADKLTNADPTATFLPVLKSQVFAEPEIIYQVVARSRKNSYISTELGAFPDRETAEANRDRLAPEWESIEYEVVVNEVKNDKYSETA